MSSFNAALPHRDGPMRYVTHRECKEWCLFPATPAKLAILASSVRLYEPTLGNSINPHTS